MRVSARFLLAAAMVLPFGLVAMPSAGAAGGTSCAHTSGTATFNPVLPKSGDSTTVTPKVSGKKGAITSCSGGGVTSATLTTKAKFHTPTNCDILLSGNPSKKPPSGTITTKWNTGATSTASVKLLPVSGQTLEAHITGKVTSGLFVGLTVNQTISFAPKTGNCLTTDLSSVTFSEVTPLTIS
jgi:hypothetical protein